MIARNAPLRVTWTALSMLLLMPSGAEAQPAEGNGVAEWGRGLDLDPRVVRELGRFSVDEASLSPEYRQALASWVREQLFAGADRQVSRLLEAPCRSFINVSFPGADFGRRFRGSGRAPTEVRFEAGLVRTEMVGCFESSAIASSEALRGLTTPEFRQLAEPRIKRIWLEGSLVCVETNGVFAVLDPTWACNRVDQFLEAGIAAEHSQTVSGAPDGSFQDVFFKESLKSFVRIPGGLALHYIHYSRTTDLGSLERWVAEGRIREAQERQVAQLRGRLTP